MSTRLGTQQRDERGRVQVDRRSKLHNLKIHKTACHDRHFEATAKLHLKPCKQTCTAEQKAATRRTWSVRARSKSHKQINCTWNREGLAHNRSIALAPLCYTLCAHFVDAKAMHQVLCFLGVDFLLEKNGSRLRPFQSASREILR